MTVDNGKEPEPGQSEEQSQQLKEKLRRIERARSRLMVCFYTLPLYILVLLMLLNERRSVTTLMFVYMAVYAFFAVDMVIRTCPRCGKQFFVKGFFLNFFTRRCVHCGLSCRPPSNSESSIGGRNF